MNLRPIAVLVFCILAPGALRAQDPALEGAQRAAGSLVLERLAEKDRDAFERVRRCPEGAVLLVDGRHDHSDRVLAGLGLHFRRCSDREFERVPLRGVRLLIIDCPGEIGPEGAARVRTFVAGGGTALTTDWAVLHVLESAFPGMLRWTRRPTRDDVVRVSELRDDPLVRWLFPRERLAAWWLENLSHPVEILSREVRVLAASDEMRSRYGEAPLVVTFRHGRGRVVHLVSHTYLQRNVVREGWESRSALDEAAGLELPTASAGYRKLVEDGTLGRLKAGDLNAALSAHQLVLNVLASALEGEGADPDTGPAPPLPARPDRAPPIPASTGVVRPARDTMLRSAPSGEPCLRAVAGLRLEVLERRDGWLQVRTPAGQSGWIADADLSRDAAR